MMIWNWIKDKRPHGKILKSRIEDDIMVVCGDSLEISYLNKTASMILDYSNGKNTVQDIEKKMLEQFDVEEIQLQEDMIEIIRDLQWKQILLLEG